MSKIKQDWQSFVKQLGKAIGIIAGVILSIIVVTNPYNNIPLMPKHDRLMGKERYVFHALAKQEKFDSAMFGASTMRFFVPAIYNTFFNANFANLSMVAATAYEQYKVADVFVRHHPNPKVLLFGIDTRYDFNSWWCTLEEDYDPLWLSTFPEWMYDTNPLNDLLYLFNLKVFKHAMDYTERAMGKTKNALLTYNEDGSLDWLPDDMYYDVDKARQRIYYNNFPPHNKIDYSPVIPPITVSEEERNAWVFPAHRYLEDLLERIPRETQTVFVFFPYHHVILPRPGSKEEVVLEECKQRIAKLSHKQENSHVFDFMIRSPVTMKDENYWDMVHFNRDIRDWITQNIFNGMRTNQSAPNAYKLLK